MQSDPDWQHLRDHYPADFAQAVELEELVRMVDPNVYLHESCVPLSQVNFDEQPKLFEERACSSGMCFV